jgi:hypothetical protein
MTFLEGASGPMILRCETCCASNPEGRSVCYACGQWLQPFGESALDYHEDRFQFRFGGIALERGLLSREQLVRALMTQSMEAAAELPYRPIGEVCREQGYLSDEAVRQVLELQQAELSSWRMAA